MTTESAIINEALAQEMHAHIIGQDPLIEAAARVLRSDWKPLNLNHASNGRANYATFIPAADPEQNR